ncbi:MAG: hypothetical protein IJW64_02190 [Clostridia bacterium]|nr:hypothetical protein [Clostridia bacterium]
MVNLYKQSDYDDALKLKKKLLKIYFVCLGVLAIPIGILFGLYLSQPFASTTEIKNTNNLYLVLNCFITAIGIIFSFIYLGIPYKRAKAYFRMLDDIKVGQKVKNVSTFVQNDLSVTEVGNVDFHVMVVLEWSEKTQEFMRRHVLVDKEKRMPNFKNGDIITYVTHANVLLSYGYKDEEDVFGE